MLLRVVALGGTSKLRGFRWVNCIQEGFIY